MQNPNDTTYVPPDDPKHLDVPDHKEVLETPRTRTSITWLAIFSFFLLLLLLIIFILQNQQQITIHFLGFDASLPMAVALLLSAVIGALLAGISAGARIVQLRLIARQHKQVDKHATPAAARH
jgi:uncharacterized integral membrane protein